MLVRLLLCVWLLLLCVLPPIAPVALTTAVAQSAAADSDSVTSAATERPDVTEAPQPTGAAGREPFQPSAMTRLPPRDGVFQFIDVGPQVPHYAGGQNSTQNLMQQPLDASQSVERFSTPEQFSIRLFADEQLMQAKPIAMNWDHRGRLWVCETVDYPHDWQPTNQGRDRIRILEDRDGDGLADHSTVFAQGLNIPTAIAFHRGGAVVQNGAETIYLKDTDGDDVADQRTVLLTGWNLGDTHGGVSNFRNGLDNWIWAIQGYNQSQPQAGERQFDSFRMGFFRFRLSQSDPPTVEQLEFVRSTTNNSWGLGISEDGLIFGSTANRAPSFFMPIANRYYERVRGWSPPALEMISDTHRFQPISDNIRQVDHHGGYTAAAGHAIYTARTYPETWWNRTAFVCGPTGKLVGTFVLSPDGAGFRSHSPSNLVASDDEWSAPIMAEVGPDGNVWIIDWYNYIIQHNPTPQGFETGPGNAYLTELRDRRFGRIYRLVYADGQNEPPLQAARLDGDDPAGLIRGLAHPSMLVRLSAQRLLVERGRLADVSEALLALLHDQNVDAIGLNPAAIHALHTLDALEAFHDRSSPAYQALLSALGHRSAAVRRTAVGLLGSHSDSSQPLIDANLLADQDAQVVLATLLAMADIGSPQSVPSLVDFVLGDRVDDPWLADAATSAAAANAGDFLIAMTTASQNANNGGSAGTGVPATFSQSALSGEAARRIIRQTAEHLARSPQNQAAVLALTQPLATTDAATAAAVVDGLTAGWPAEQSLALDGDGQEALLRAFDQADDDGKAALLQLAEKWHSDVLDARKAAVQAALLEKIADEALTAERRIAIARRIVSLDPANAQVPDRLATLIDLSSPPDLAAGIIAAIGHSTAAEAADQLVDLASTSTPAVRDQAIQTLLARPAMTHTLLQAIEDQRLSLNDLTALQRQTLGDHPQEPIRRFAARLLAAGGSGQTTDRQRLVEQKLPLAQQTGDVQAGKRVFLANCASCHTYHGEGTTVGPDLTGMSVHPKAELLTHILDPSRSVESNYRLYTVLTTDGAIISGLLAGESQTSIDMIDAQANRHSVLRSDIERLVASRQSAMPEGLEETMGDQGLVDLLEFLTDKGQYLPLSIAPVATAVSTRGMFYDPDSTSERLVFDDWGVKSFQGVPFLLVDPQQDQVNNVVLLHSENGSLPPAMPRSVKLTCETSAVAIHLLGGVAGWGATGPGNGAVSMNVRLHYGDGGIEDHPLVNGQHIADYIRVIDVPQSQLAFNLGGRQVRYLSIRPRRTAVIQFIEFVKADRTTAPIVMAVTLQLTD